MADEPFLTPRERSWMRAQLDDLDQAEHHSCDGQPDCRDCLTQLISRSSIGAGLRELLAEEAS